MRRFTTFLLTILLVLSLVACGGKGTWQEQYDLGMRYLNEGNYEEAVIAFTAAIEIDAKRPEAYLGAAEAYIAADDIDAAIAILEKGYAATNDDSLKNRLDEIKSGTFNDYWGRRLKETHYDSDGAVTCWFKYEYNDQGKCVGITSYGPDGSQIQHIDQRYDAQGRMVYGVYSQTSFGTMAGAAYTYNSEGDLEKITLDSGRSIAYSYDAEGRQVRSDSYYEDGTLEWYMTFEYGEGYRRHNRYNADGTLYEYSTCSYDDAGKLTEQCNYSGDGQLTDRHVYYYAADGHRTGSEVYDGDGNLLSSTNYQD